MKKSTLQFFLELNQDKRFDIILLDCSTRKPIKIIDVEIIHYDSDGIIVKNRYNNDTSYVSTTAIARITPKERG
jgi:hypothetical protein